MDRKLWHTLLGWTVVALVATSVAGRERMSRHPHEPAWLLLVCWGLVTTSGSLAVATVAAWWREWRCRCRR